MKSLKVLLLVLAICCFPLFGKVYKVGMDFNYPPVSFIDQNGKMAGFEIDLIKEIAKACLLYTSPSPRDRTRSRMPSSA